MIPIVTVEIEEGGRIEVLPLDQFKIYRKKTYIRAIQMDVAFSVKRDDGEVEYGSPGDYMCLGLLGKLSIVKKEIFEATCEVVDD